MPVANYRRPACPLCLKILIFTEYIIFLTSTCPLFSNRQLGGRRQKWEASVKKGLKVLWKDLELTPVAHDRNQGFCEHGNVHSGFTKFVNVPHAKWLVASHERLHSTGLKLPLFTPHQIMLSYNVPIILCSFFRFSQNDGCIWRTV
jgi:hypothetical protein